MENSSNFEKIADLKLFGGKEACFNLDWDLFYLRLAREVSKNSKCLSRKVGSVLVKDNSVIGVGYNGPARGVKHCFERPISFYDKLEDVGVEENGDNTYYDECPRRSYGYKTGFGLHLCQASHSERNAILQCAKLGISTKDSVIYCYCPMPCKDCTIELVNAGVKEIVCLEGEAYDKYAEVIAQEAGLVIRKVNKDNL